MPSTRSSSVDAVNNGRSGQSTTGQDSRRYQEDSMQRYNRDSGDNLIGRLISGGPSARSYSQSSNDQQSSNGGYSNDYSSAARAA